MSALTDRDTNLQTTSESVNVEKEAAAGQENTVQETQQHKQVLERKIAENNGKPGQTYISPSDAILSPASQKLADLKQRQMNKSGGKTPLARSLFGRTLSSCSSGFGDVEATEEKQR